MITHVFITQLAHRGASSDGFTPGSVRASAPYFARVADVVQKHRDELVARKMCFYVSKSARKWDPVNKWVAFEPGELAFGELPVGRNGFVF